jgi:hypothetical protein
MRHINSLQRLTRILVENRLLHSLGLSIACGLVLQTLYPIQQSNTLLRLIALERPNIYLGLVWSYTLFLFTTPFLCFSILFLLAYFHFYVPDLNKMVGPLPPYPDTRSRRDLFLVIGEVHHQQKPTPSPSPQWFSIPERGLYTGIAIIGATGSAKTAGMILPAIHASHESSFALQRLF